MLRFATGVPLLAMLIGLRCRRPVTKPSGGQFRALPEGSSFLEFAIGIFLATQQEPATHELPLHPRGFDRRAARRPRQGALAQLPPAVEQGEPRSLRRLGRAQRGAFAPRRSLRHPARQLTRNPSPQSNTDYIAHWNLGLIAKAMEKTKGAGWYDGFYGWFEYMNGIFLVASDSGGGALHPWPCAPPAPARLQPLRASTPAHLQPCSPPALHVSSGCDARRPSPRPVPIPLVGQARRAASRTPSSP